MSQHSHALIDKGTGRMEFVSLGGDKVPALGLGTWQLRGAHCRRAVGEAVELGYRHIDTAQVYGNESEVGAAVTAGGVDRDELFLTTKISDDRRAADDVERSVEESLRRLGLDHVDLLLVHWPAHFERMGETLEGMTRLQDRGLTRHIGVSNFTASQFTTALSAAPVVCNQVEYHPFLSQADLLDVMRRHDAVLTAYSPLARGAVSADETLRRVGAAHGKSAAQVSLRWLLDQDGVMAVPKAGGREHLAANLAVFDFTLTAREREQIDRLARGQRLVDPSWASWED